MDNTDYVVGDTVFMRFMGVPGTVVKVVKWDRVPLAYLIEVEDRGVDIFRTDEVEDFDLERWER